MSVSNPIIPHLVDLDREPKRVKPTRRFPATTSTTDVIPWIEDDNPEEISQGQAPNLSQSPSTLPKAMITSEDQSESQLPDGEASAEPTLTPPEPEPQSFNYGASAQRIRIKKPNLQRETLERIFQQRRESESEAETATPSSPPSEPTIPLIPSNFTNRVVENKFEDAPVSVYPAPEKIAVVEHTEEVPVEQQPPQPFQYQPQPTYQRQQHQFYHQQQQQQPRLETKAEAQAELEGREGNDDDDDDDDEVEIVEEYWRQASPATVTVSIHPGPAESYMTYPKKLSIISECDSEGGSVGLNPEVEIEHSTIRRASDFTDSFRKLEPFKFDLPSVIEVSRCLTLFILFIFIERRTRRVKSQLSC